ncbi:YncE family protein [Pseudomonas baetica]|uniref:YncE family protein n=1 Tax=Pseudomonas baetica TaxID=674054 RepID=UPI0028726219|nr:hypothetical protein [Pseudomonas baetica]MDR9864572.1 hypothetical protein [Pseudomonas baetica]
MSKARMIQTLAITRPYLPEMIKLDPTDPVAAGGVTIKDATASKGVEVSLLAYLNQAEKDFITLYLNDFPVADTTIAIGGEGKDTSLWIPAHFFEQGYNHIKFGVKRVSQNEDFTEPLVVLYHFAPPGGNPLILDLSISHTSIGQEEAENFSVTVTYENMRWYDWIFISCNGTNYPYRLVPLSTTPRPPAPTSVVIAIPKDVLLRAGDHRRFAFKYRVTDYLQNPSVNPNWSPEKIADVHLNRRTLPEALLREIPTESNDDKNTVDLQKMNGGPLWALIHLIETVWASGDSMVLTFTAELGGSVVATYSETVPVTTLPTQFAWEIPNSKVVPKSQVTVGYQQVRGGAVIGSSKAAVAQVIGEALPAATLVFTNGPYEVLAGKAFDVRLLLTRDGMPQANVVVTLRLASGFEFPGGGGVERDFITDAKGVVTVTGIIASGTEGAHELVAKSKGANDAVTRVEVLAEGPVGLIDVGEPQYNIVITNEGDRIFVELLNKVLIIDTATNKIVGSIAKTDAEIFYEMHITPQSNKIYANTYGKDVFTIDLITSNTIKAYSDGCYFLDVSPDGTRLASLNQNTLNIIETATDKITNTFSFSNTRNILFSADGSKAYNIIVSNNIFYLVSINSQTGVRINTLQLPNYYGGRDLHLSLDGTQIYASFYNTSPNRPRTFGILVIDANSLRQLKQFDFPGHIKIIAVFPNHLLLQTERTTSAYFFDPLTGKEDGEIEIGFVGPGKMVYTPNQKRLYACIDARFLAVVSTGK